MERNPRHALPSRSSCIRQAYGEVFRRLGRILGIMSSRTARWFALALVAFLLAQPVPFQAFAAQRDDSCCCKDKVASCCRRHGHMSGPAVASRDCCDQCQIAVHKSQPVAATTAPSTAGSEPAPESSHQTAWASWIPSSHRDSVLFERPPPSAA